MGETMVKRQLGFKQGLELYGVLVEDTSYMTNWGRRREVDFGFWEGRCREEKRPGEKCTEACPHNNVLSSKGYSQACVSSLQNQL